MNRVFAALFTGVLACAIVPALAQDKAPEKKEAAKASEKKAAPGKKDAAGAKASEKKATDKQGAEEKPAEKKRKRVGGCG